MSKNTKLWIWGIIALLAVLFHKKILVLLGILLYFIIVQGQNSSTQLNHTELIQKYRDSTIVLNKDFLVKNDENSSLFIYPIIRKDELIGYENKTSILKLKKGTTFDIGKVMPMGGSRFGGNSYSSLEVLSCSDKKFEKEFLLKSKSKNKHMYISTRYKEFMKHFSVKK